MTLRLHSTPTLPKGYRLLTNEETLALGHRSRIALWTGSDIEHGRVLVGGRYVPLTVEIDLSHALVHLDADLTSVEGWVAVLPVEDIDDRDPIFAPMRQADGDEYRPSNTPTTEERLLDLELRFSLKLAELRKEIESIKRSA